MNREDLLNFVFRQGAGKQLVARPVEVDDSVVTTSDEMPLALMESGALVLPDDTHRRLARTRFGDKCARADFPVAHSLVAAFSNLRREPFSFYNEHRGYSSVRSKYPVEVFVVVNSSTYFLDAYQQLLVRSLAPSLRSHAGEVLVVLAPRYTHLPSYYGRLRGPLVDIESGIALRALCDSLAIFGVTFAEFVLLENAWDSFVEETGAGTPAEWAAPIVARIRDHSTERLATESAYLVPPLSTDAFDPVLEEVKRVNSSALASVLAQATHLALPTATPGAQSRTWAEVLWDRTAGRMPLRLSGVAGVPVRVHRDIITDMISFMNARPPGDELAKQREEVSVHLCVRGVDGLSDGVHELVGDQLSELRTDAFVMTKLESIYGYPLAPSNGCAVRLCTAVWVISLDVSQFPDQATRSWTLTQYLAGWMAQGIALAAAAHKLYARPVRAYDESELAEFLGLTANRVPILAVLCGAESYQSLSLDLRP